MYGDPAAIRNLARGFDERAEALRHEADALAAVVAAVPWQGVAATAFRSRARDRASSLWSAAAAHEDAATALEQHAQRVEDLLEQIAAAERRFERFLDVAERWWLRSLRPPPPGSREWLTFDLPRAA